MATKRGRKSAAETEAAAIEDHSPALVVPRPEPPGDLTEEAAVEWRAVTNRMPAEWFPRETHALLAQYCRHAVEARRVAQLLEQHMRVGRQVDSLSSEWLEMYDRLLKLQEREGRALSSLATRMRISQQSTYAKDKQKGGLSLPRPWEAHEG